MNDSSSNDVQQPLDGITVLDLTQYEAGTSCTMMLAWLGARVIKVERPGHGDQGRHVYQDDSSLPDSFYFLLLNLNKESVELDLKSERGQETFYELVEQADVVAENFSLGVMEKLGIDYETLSEINPEIIYVSMKGFGTYGPWKDYKSFDPIAQATGGTTSVTGFPDGPPVRPNAFVGDTGTGLMAAIGTVGAIIQREKTGKGQRVEVSQQDTTVFFTRPRMAETLRTGEAMERYGNHVPGRTPSGLYPCAPGGPNDYINLHLASDRVEMWQNLLEVIGREAVIDDERYFDPAFRHEHRDEIDGWIEAWSKQRDKLDAMEALSEAGVPCGAVLSTKELFENEQLNERDMIVPVEHPERGVYEAVGCPLKMEDNPVEVRRPPLLGEHTTEVLDEFLDESNDGIAGKKRASEH